MIKIPTNPKSEPYKQKIDEVIKKLPGEVADKIMKGKHPFVFIAGENVGDHFDGIIVLNTNIMDKKTEKYQKYVIAHEFAHFFLNHPPPMTDELRKKQDNDADAKAKEWGFEP